MKHWLWIIAALCAAAASPASAQAEEQWSPWIHMRRHFEIQMRTEEVSPTVMHVRLRIRPDVAAIAREPSYSHEACYVEYYQGIDQSSTGGLGNTSMSAPRRIVFPPDAPATCVYEEGNLYAVNQPAGGNSRLYMDHSVSMLPILAVGGELRAGVDLVLQFGANVGPDAVTRFSGTSQSSFAPAC